MRPFIHHIRLIGVALLASGFGLPCRADQQGQNGAQSPVSGQAQPVATLQITEKTGRFTVNAERADVQSVLKLLFDQANKQFILDSSVTGLVTMRLNAQPLNTVLEAICGQVFLRYRYDPNTSITRFERNEEAIKNAFSRLRVMNSFVRQQLRGMGYDLPNDNLSLYYQNGLQVQNGAASGMQNNVAGGIVGGRGGFGGGGGAPSGPGGPPAGSSEEARRFQKKADDARQGNSIAQKRDKDTTGSRSQEGLKTPGGLEQRSLNQDTNNDALGVNRVDSPYLQFLSQNNLVSINIPRGQPEPMTDVILQLGRQANVPILVDPSVPTGPKFRLDGKISPRPLPDALNVLAYYGRLEWRWVGDRIFVTAAPDFQIYFGESLVPRLNSRGRAAVPSQTLPESKTNKQEGDQKQNDKGKG